MDAGFQERFNKIINKIEEVGEEYAEARGQSYQYQELKHSVLANLIKKYPDLPVSKAEIEARASQEYRDYVIETSQAITKELKLKAQYEKWRSSFEAVRSLSSLEKATIHKIGH
jgi:hypothetical protein